MRTPVGILLAIYLSSSSAASQHEVWNFESPHVHPLERLVDGSLLLAVNTLDNRLEVFDLGAGNPTPVRSIPVGLDPVSVRARTLNEAWVCNHLSDSLSVVDLSTGNVVETLSTDDEPCDVVFAGGRAFVSCSQPNTLLVFDAEDTSVEPVRIVLEGEEPRALAVDPLGQSIYVAFFESGNGSTILGGGFLQTLGPYLINAVSDPLGPYGGINPPPNAGIETFPPVADGLVDPPPMALIVKRDELGRYYDDNDGDWTEFVSGDSAWRSGRIPGWQLLDHDVGIIDVESLEVDYADGMMNLCMALDVHPSGHVSVVGTDARNEIRYEPNLNGSFLEVVGAGFDPGGHLPVLRVDLNPHLNYASPTLPQSLRNLSIGDPRAVLWNAEGTVAYVTGMGSNNVVLFDTTGFRIGLPIEVGQGPTGLAIDDGTSRLFVLNHFDASISVVDLASRSESARIPFSHDPTPRAVKEGRPHLYGTHETSGTGHVSCASCHVDARTDRLAWDLGNPEGSMKPLTGQNLIAGEFEDWHPMKGPMLTQTLQDIIGKEPFHWRGDKTGLEDFNGAFTGLQGDDAGLSPGDMQEFEDFLATIRIPPNPFRNEDNSLPTSLPLPGHFTSGINGPGGLPMVSGNPERGLQLFSPDNDHVECATCHALPSGVGPNLRLTPTGFATLPLGPMGEAHSGLVGLDGFSNRTLKVAQLRTLYERVGFNREQPKSRLGFGFLHDGSIDTLSTFLVPFQIGNDSDVADIVAFLLCFSGSDLPEGARDRVNRAPGIPSLDAHAAIGRQITLKDLSQGGAHLVALARLMALSSSGAVGLIVKGRRAGVARGFYHLNGNMYQSDRVAESLSQTELRSGIGTGDELTWTVVPRGSEIRMGVDRDADGAFDGDELDASTDPDEAASNPCLVLPASPGGLGVQFIRRHAVDFTWADQSYNEDGFELQARILAEDPFVTIASFPRNTTKGTAGSLEPGQRYRFRITAVNCAGTRPGPELFVETEAQRWREESKQASGRMPSVTLPPR